MVAINELGGSAPRLYTSRPLIRLCQPIIAAMCMPRSPRLSGKSEAVVGAMRRYNGRLNLVGTGVRPPR